MKASSQSKSVKHMKKQYYTKDVANSEGGRIKRLNTINIEYKL